MELELTGLIFEMRRFSTHDGKGIRTTIFFKGCPLQCVWCQNPEGLDAVPRPIYFPSKCIHCGICCQHSQHGGVYEEAGQIHLRPEREERWEEIIAECPTGAIRMDSKFYTVEELINEIEKDRVFYRCGGGVSLSGGEPLMQPEFAEAFLKRLKEMGLHTAIETALLVPLQSVQMAVPYLDQIFSDLKIMDPEDHIKFTKASNEQIKKNLMRLLTSENQDRVVVRTPLIPQMTATEKNLASIAEFLSSMYPEVHYELLNYNPLAAAKYHLVEREYCFEENNPEMYTKEEMAFFGDVVRAHGIKNLILEI